LELVRVPPNAQPLLRNPNITTVPIFSIPSRPLISRTEWWQARESFGAAQRWLGTHPPAHLLSEGTASSGKAGHTPTAFTGIYADAQTSTYTGATLEIGIAQGRDGRTYWAAQALALPSAPSDHKGCVLPYPHVRMPGGPPSGTRPTGTLVCGGAVNASRPAVAENRATGKLPHAVDTPVPPTNDGVPQLTNGGTRGVTRPAAP
jgi:hypothetical protein